MNIIRKLSRIYLRNNYNNRYLYSFSSKHIGNTNEDLNQMLKKVNVNNIDNLVNEIVPKNIETLTPYFNKKSEYDSSKNINNIFEKNIIKKNLIGLDFHDTILPPIIQRKILENPKWYTAYTPYQSEISQGRLEAQFNFQTLITELTGLDISNISLLDSGSASVEALNLSLNVVKNKKNAFFCSNKLNPVILDILKTRAKILNLNLIIDDPINCNPNDEDLFGFMFSYPDVKGEINQYCDLISKLKDNNVIVSCHSDLMSLLLLKSPKDIGIDICFGSSQRFGIPIWFGGPHPAFFSVKKDYLRLVPGRIVGKSIDAENNECFRIALQTREQHIRKEKSTSNICTSQALLSVTSSMYSIFHGKEGLINISEDIFKKTALLVYYLRKNNIKVNNENFFDTIEIEDKNSKEIINNLRENGYEVLNNNNKINISINEIISYEDINKILNIILNKEINIDLINNNNLKLDQDLLRDNNFLNQSIFTNIKTETDLLRYIQSLENKDYTLTDGMIPLGSCTMKLNATSELMPLSSPKLQNIHPYTSCENKKGYIQMIEELTDMLTKIIGLDYISYQSNSGAMGEYSGLLCIKKYHEKNNDKNRNLCVIPESAHGTNFASAKLAGMEILKYNDNILIDDFKNLILTNKENISCLMITYPNTYGIFDNNIKDICNIIHDNGGLVYMDGANMNAQLGLTNPGICGADVCHLNLHKTFCIPHGGGGPGMGPILVNEKLKDFLPGNIYDKNYAKSDSYGSITMSNFSSASILSITYQYLKMMGSEDLKEATKIALLNSNYLMESLKDNYSIYKTNSFGRVGHEFIINFNEFRDIDIKDVDIAKRLIDYSFHPPTMSWPIPNSIMIEPTESESKQELDRFIEAMLCIREEIEEIRKGEYSIDNNVLKNSPHSLAKLLDWNYPYNIRKAYYPNNNLIKNKFIPSVSRVNDLYGDKNLVLK